MTHYLRTFYYLLLVSLPVLAQSGGSCGAGDLATTITPLIGLLSERIITMALQLDTLTTVVQRIDVTTRTRLAEFLAKYDALRKENEQLKLQLVDQLKVGEVNQAIVHGNVRALEGVVTAINNFGGSL